MKTYLAFCGAQYYPFGGFNDFLIEGDIEKLRHLITETFIKNHEIYSAPGVGFWGHIICWKTKTPVLVCNDYNGELVWACDTEELQGKLFDLLSEETKLK